MRIKKTILVTLILAFGAGPLWGSCGAQTGELGPSTGTCTSGKCDGFADTLDDYYSDMRSIGPPGAEKITDGKYLLSQVG